MITLKSHALPPSPFNTPTIRYYEGKPETTVEGECDGLRDRMFLEYVHLRKDGWGSVCCMCAAYTGPMLPWMDNIDRWQDHPMRCR